MWIDEIRTVSPVQFTIATSKPHLKTAALAIFAVLSAAILDSIVPLVFKNIVNAATVVATPNNPGELWYWIAIYIAVGFTSAALWRFSGFTGALWATGVRATSRYFLSSYITKHSYGYFNNRFAGAVANKINHASEGVSNLVQNVLWSWLSLFVSLAVGLVLVFLTNVWVGLIFVGWLTLIIPMNFILARKRIPLGAEAQRRETVLRGHTVDLFTNISAVFDFTRRLFELKSLRELITIRRKAGLRNWWFGETILSVNSFLEILFIGGMIVATVFLWTEGTLTAGDIILILTLVAGLRGELEFIGQRFNNFAENYSEVKEGLEEILEPNEIVDVPYAVPLSVSSGEIVFEDVSFDYGEGGGTVIEHLDTTIPAGQKVGLVGHSGAGKSTFVKLLLRQYDITGGKILIDEQNIALSTQESVRGSIAVIPQEPLLFHRSIAENISYGKPDAIPAEIERAARLAQAHEFIKELPQGYETLVGERGVKLSGGQRQRVAIARAILKNAPILILDEATSSLDSESEAAIQGALSELMKNKTVIAVAHRLSTLRAMDRIIVLDNGQIVEDGTHDSLLEQGGIYASLWNHQAGGFLTE